MARPANKLDYEQYLLEGRRRFIQGQATTTTALASAYKGAAGDLQYYINKTTPGTLRHAHLAALQANLDNRVKQLNNEVLAAIHHGIWLSSSAGAQGPAKSAQQLLEGVLPNDAVKKLFAGVNERAVLTLLAKTGVDGLKISDRVWKAGDAARDDIILILEDALARGKSAKTIAREVQLYLQPGVAVAHKAEVRKRLGVSKDVSYQAMRLARTEMNNAFHEGMIAANHHHPAYLGIFWRLSEQHRVPDVCDDMATNMVHGKPGWYPRGAEPVRPHPQCFCVPVCSYIPPARFVEQLKGWVDDPTSDPYIERWHQKVKPFLPGRRVVVPVAPTGTPSTATTAPVAEVVENFRALGGGVSDTFLGDVNGVRYVFKSPAPVSTLNMLRGNAEAELLASEMLSKVGLNAPRARYATFVVNGVERRLLQTEFVSDVVLGKDLDSYQIATVKRDQFKTMQVMDLLMGNGDRHGGNFFIRTAGNIGEVVPIDHNMAFATDRVISQHTRWQKCFLAEIGTGVQSPYHIIQRNAVGRQISRDSNDASYLAIVKKVKDIFTDDILAEMINQLPMELANLARQKEILDVLKWRRDNLTELVKAGR